MATTLALIALLAARSQGAPPATETFTDSALGLTFQHPTTWVRVAQPAPPPPPKKPRTLKDALKKPAHIEKRAPEGLVVFSIPAANGGAPSELTIVRASFSDAPEKWQQIQADANRNLKRDVERQWQQEILGVPLLLTRIGYADNGAATTTVTGLLYNAAPYKLLFRLTGPTTSFDAAQAEFTQAMESLRTTDDKLPTAQEPGKPIAPPPPPPGPDAKHALFAKPQVTLLKAPVTVPVAQGEKKLVLRLPEGWTAKPGTGDEWLLSHEGIKTPVTVRLYSGSTPTAPTEALSAQATKSLETFKSVDLREDTPGTPNKAGNPVLAIWRKGAGESGPLQTMDAVAVVGDTYMLFSFRPTPGDAGTSERRVVQTMLDSVGLEPAS